MSDDDRFLDFATVREMLLDANERRGQLTYEQKAALQHAEWAASEMRNGFKTIPETFTELKNKLLEVDVLSKHPGLAAKLAELIPQYPDDVKAVLGSKRISADDGEINAILDIVRQVVGFE